MQVHWLLPCQLTRIEWPWHVLSSAVQLHELDAPLASVFTRRQRQRHTVRWTPDDRPQQIDSHTTRFTCHTKRVKAGLPLSPQQPLQGHQCSSFWGALQRT